MGLAVFGVLGSELEEVPLLRALVKVVADAMRDGGAELDVANAMRGCGAC